MLPRPVVAHGADAGPGPRSGPVGEREPRCREGLEQLLVRAFLVLRGRLRCSDARLACRRRGQEQRREDEGEGGGEHGLVAIGAGAGPRACH